MGGAAPPGLSRKGLLILFALLIGCTGSPGAAQTSASSRSQRLVADPSAWSRQWLEPPGASGSVFSITVGGLGLIAVGFNDGDGLVDMWTSSDGRTWNQAPGKELGPGEIFDIAVGGPGLVAVGAGHEGGISPPVLWTSEDGLSWSRGPKDQVFRGSFFNALTSLGKRLVAVGGGEHRAWFSDDGLTWERASVPETSWLSMTDVAAASDRLVAVGWGQRRDVVIWTSTDGVTWTDVPVDEETFPDVSGIRRVTGGPKGFVALGFTGGEAHGDPAMWTSEDGLEWRRVSMDQAAVQPDQPEGTSAYLSGVAAGRGGYVAVGGVGQCREKEQSDCPSAEAAVWTSPDGRSWVRVPTSPLFRVVDPARPGQNGGAWASSVARWGSRFAVVGDYDGRPSIWISQSTEE